MFNSFGLTVTALVTTICIFIALDAYATREYPVYVEDFRRIGMTDEETVAAAVQEANKLKQNIWWIHDKNPYLIFEDERSYELDPIIYTTFDIEITEHEDYGMVGYFHPLPDTTTP